jgi:SAM-dependent methyltransferase
VTFVSHALARAYRSLKSRYLTQIGYVVPERYQSAFVHLGGGAEVRFIYERFFSRLPLGGRILIVGVMGGRDYFHLLNAGYSVVAFDLGAQPDLHPIIRGNVEDPLPFEEKSFDAVLIGEVLEHLREDATALSNLRRVLRDDGILVVSVPFYHDKELGHIRIHSPVSAERLLRISGFRILDFVERPGVLWLNSLNYLHHLLNLLAYLTTGRTIYSLTLRFFGGLEWSLGHKRWLRPIRRVSSAYGGYFLCQKSAAMDHVELNRSLYTLVDEAPVK